MGSESPMKMQHKILSIIFILFIVEPIFSADQLTKNNLTQSSKEGVDESNKWNVFTTLLYGKMLVKHLDSNGNESNSESQMKGTSYGLGASVDLSTNEFLSWKVSLGYESLKVSDADSNVYCPTGSSSVCSVNINYVSLGLAARFNINQNNTQFWLGLGLNLKQPLSKKASALSEDDIKATSTYGLLAGVDIAISPRSFIPLSFEQQYFFRSDSVQSEILLFRIGFGKRF